MEREAAHARLSVHLSKCHIVGNHMSRLIYLNVVYKLDNIHGEIIQEKYLAVNKRLFMAFVDLEKAFDRVPRKVIWWALRKLGVEEWIVRLVQGMYANARSRVRVGEGFSKEFEVKVGVHQGSVLSPLLFIIVLEALSREFRAGVPWEDLYAAMTIAVDLGRKATKPTNQPTYMQMILSSLLTP